MREPTYEIILYRPRSWRQSGRSSANVRIKNEAYDLVAEWAEESGMTMSAVVTQIILQSEEFVRFRVKGKEE